MNPAPLSRHNSVLHLHQCLFCQSNSAVSEERIEVLEKMVLRLYEDMVAGRISEANFNLMLDKTQKEQAELKRCV